MKISAKSDMPSSVEPAGTIEFFWAHQKGFGAYLKRLRAACGLTLREAGSEIGMSHSNLARLENSLEVIGPIDFKVLGQIAEVYRQDKRELYHEHGYRWLTDSAKINDVLDAEKAFAAVVLSKELKPAGLRAGALDGVHARFKSQMLELMRTLASQPEPLTLLERLIAESQVEEES